MSEYMSPAQIADDLGVSTATVYGWLHRGLGPDRLKVGRHVRVPRVAYEAWLSKKFVGGECI